MTEFVEQGRGIVPGNKYWFAGFAFHKVRVIRYDSGYFAVLALLVAVGVHPGAGTLAFAGVRIEIPQTNVFAAGLVFRSEEHTSELQSRLHLVCRLLLEKKK